MPFLSFCILVHDDLLIKQVISAFSLNSVIECRFYFSMLFILFYNLVKYLLSRRCVFKGEHCEAHVKKFEYLFGSNRSGQVPANGGINWTVDNSWHLNIQLIKLGYRKLKFLITAFNKSILLIVHVDSKASRKLDIFSWTIGKYWTTSLLCSRYVTCHKASHDDSNSDCEGDF